MPILKAILIVEDDPAVAKYLREIMVDNGYPVQVARDGISALDMASKIEPDLVILDLGLPDMGGESVCSELKKKYPDLPVIILTARSTTNDVVSGLNLGADDYIKKPFIADELIARVKARLRKQGINNNKIKLADLELDPNTLEVKRGSKLIILTPQEFKLLHYLMSNPGRVLTREMILNRVWLYSPDVESRVVDIYIGYLRKKIDSGFQNKLLKSARGFGYMIKSD